MGGGGSKANNEVNMTVRQILQILNNSTQTCSTEGQNIFSIIASSSCQDGDITISGIKSNQRIGVTQNCAQQASSDSKLAAEIEAKVKQQSETVAQALSLPWGGAESNNLTSQLLDVGQKIQNEYTNIVKSTLINRFGIEALRTGQCKSGNIVILDITNDQYIDSLMEAVQKSETVSEAISKVTTTIDQLASATVENTFGPSASLSMVCILVIGAFLWKGADVVTDPKKLIPLIILIVLILGIYLGLAYWRKWFPFEVKQEVTPGPDPIPDPNKPALKYGQIYRFKNQSSMYSGYLSPCGGSTTSGCGTNVTLRPDESYAKYGGDSSRLRDWMISGVGKNSNDTIKYGDIIRVKGMNSTFTGANLYLSPCGGIDGCGINATLRPDASYNNLGGDSSGLRDWKIVGDFKTGTEVREGDIIELWGVSTKYPGHNLPLSVCGNNNTTECGQNVTLEPNQTYIHWTIELVK